MAENKEKSTKTRRKTKEERLDSLKKRKGVKESNERMPDGLEVLIPRSPSFEGKKFRPNLVSVDPSRPLFISGGKAAAPTPKEIASHKMRTSLDPKVQTVFTGTVTGLRNLINPKTGETTAYALIWSNFGVEGFAGRTVMIASSEFFLFNGTESSLEVHPAKYITGLLGAEIEFTLLDIIKDGDTEKVLIGSRRRPALKKIATYWRGATEGDFLIKEGSILEARIINVRPRGILVEIFGMEFFIPGKELSYANISDCNEYFKTGQRLNVIVNKIDRRENGEIFAELSYKDTMPNERREFISQYAVGDLIECVTTNVVVSESGEVSVFAKFMDTLDIMCKMQPNVSIVPIKGETVRVKIVGIDSELLQIWGAVVHVFPIY